MKYRAIQGDVMFRLAIRKKKVYLNAAMKQKMFGAQIAAQPSPAQPSPAQPINL